MEPASDVKTAKYTQRVTAATLLAHLEARTLSVAEVFDQLPNLQQPATQAVAKANRLELLADHCQRCQARDNGLVLMPHKRPGRIPDLLHSLTQAWCLARFQLAYHTLLTDAEAEALAKPHTRVVCPTCAIASFKRAKSFDDPLFVCSKRHYFPQPLTITQYAISGHDDPDQARSLARRQAALAHVRDELSHFREALEEEALRQHLRQHEALLHLSHALTVCRSCHRAALNREKHSRNNNPLHSQFTFVPPPGPPPPLPA